MQLPPIPCGAYQCPPATTPSLRPPTPAPPPTHTHVAPPVRYGHPIGLGLPRCMTASLRPCPPPPPPHRPAPRPQAIQERFGVPRSALRIFLHYQVWPRPSASWNEP